MLQTKFRFAFEFDILNFNQSVYLLRDISNANESEDKNIGTNL
jgi:hypothetical protein